MGVIVVLNWALVVLLLVSDLPESFALQCYDNEGSFDASLGLGSPKSKACGTNEICRNETKRMYCVKQWSLV